MVTPFTEIEMALEEADFLAKEMQAPYAVVADGRSELLYVMPLDQARRSSYLILEIINYTWEVKWI